MPDNLCIDCGEEVRPRQDGLLCDGCERWQHRKCNTGIPRNVYLIAVKNKEDIDWQCEQCASSHSQPAPAAESTRLSLESQNFQAAQLEESSLLDPLPCTDVESTDEITYNKVEGSSIRGRVKLYDSLGFSYSVKQTTASSVVWRCTVRNSRVKCPATIRESNGVMFRSSRSHHHEGQPGAHIAAKIQKYAKLTAQQHPLKSAPSIVNNILLEELNGVNCPALQKLDYIS